MRLSGPQFCDVALPVPVDQPFTYRLPETLHHRVQPGSRVVVPFGARKLTGVVLRRHQEAPRQQAREVLRLLDEEPALTAELLDLGRWIADYYCAPFGEVLRTMLPLAGETRAGKVVSLTPSGVEAARQFITPGTEDPAALLLHALEKRSLSEQHLKRKIPGADAALRSLKRKGLLTIEPILASKDPSLSRSGRLMVALADLQEAPERLSPEELNPERLNKGERWLIDFLREQPGAHEIEILVALRKDAKTVARRLARTGVVKLWNEFDTRNGMGLGVVPPAVTLNRDQKAALEPIRSSIRCGKYRTFLIHGVTGSGKTEVYLRAIEEALSLGESSLLLVPEIALTPAVAAQFFGRFGDKVAILHSAFSGLERSDQWRRLRQGKARVAVGTRSAVFAPVENLGLIVVDEEHDGSYKQDETPRYNGRDVAIVRAQKAGATVVLGSATPCLESRYNVEREKYELLSMPERIERRPMPKVDVIDMRLEFVETRRQDLFSRALEEAIRNRLEQGEQVMLLLNRRGFSSYVACRSCGERIECQNCSVTLTFHRQARKLECHYCDYAEPVPSLCPKCESEHIYFIGSGSEKVEDYLRRTLPEARIARLDRDSVRGKDHYETVLNAFRNREYDILVGTQMIAKGHDIPNVTLVGVVAADVGLGMPDFRAAERTFQLLTQVAGRAGRGDLPGRVLMQTINPDHYAIRFAADQDYDGFYKKEIHFRRMLHYPPLAPLAILIVRSKKMEDALTMSGRLGRYLHGEVPEGIRLLGPSAAPVARLKTDYRFQFIIKAKNRRALGGFIKQARDFAEGDTWPATALVVDVDPLSVF